MWNKRIRQAIAYTGLITAVILCSKSPFLFSEAIQKRETNVEIERQWQGYYCGLLSPSRMVISTQEQWKEVWEKMHSIILPRPELPKVNFEKEMVLAVFMGKKRSGGYEIKISKITKTEAEILVEVVEKEPPPDSLRTMAFTSPYHVVAIKKYPLVVNFQGP